MSFIDKILAEIEGSASPIVLLTGPARSGKTSVLLEWYRRSQNARAGASAVLLAPNAPSADALRTALLSGHEDKALLGPRVMTFDRLVGRVLTAARRTPRAVTPFERHLLLAELIRSGCQAGSLPAMRPVADAPGLVSVVDHAIAELKRNAVEPEAFAELVPRSPDKRRDLANLYDDYQRRLHKTGSYDREGLTWLARDILAEQPRLPLRKVGLEGVNRLLMDGFTDFTPTQLDIISLLGERLEKTVISLPLDESDGRKRMWHWTARTAARLRSRLGDSLEEIVLTPPTHGLVGLGASLFDPDAESGRPPSELQVLCASGADSEVEEVARRVKGRLLEGAPAGSIAVLARSLSDYRPRIERAFRAAGIPVASAPTPLCDIPIVRFVLGAAQLGRGSACEYSDVLNVLNSSYFLPQSLGSFCDRDVTMAEMVIREANVFHGREAYARASQELARRAERQAAGIDDEETTPAFLLGSMTCSPLDIRRAGELLEALLSALEPIARADQLNELVDVLDLESAALQSGDDALIARDLRALVALRSALLCMDDPELTPAGLGEALAAIRLPAPREESVVDVLDVLDARALRYEHVYLLGLSEGQFPYRPGEGSILTEADRQRCRDAGLSMDCRGDLTAREMLLFYLAITRGEESLTISYWDTDAGGRAAGPGAFLQSLLDPVGGLESLGRSVLTRLPVGRFVPPTGDVASPRTAVMASLAGLFRSTGNPGGSLPALPPGSTTAMHSALRGIFVMGRRWRPEPPGRWDGRLSDPELLALLGRRFPGETVFSPSALNTFGQCPWQFYARYVLKLHPLGEPARQIEAVSRGTLVHDLLCAVFTGLRERIGGPVPIRQLDPAEAADLLDEALAEESERYTPAYPVLWEIQLREMREQILEYILTQRGQAYPGQSACHMELGFGLGREQTGGMGSASGLDAVEMRTPTGIVRLRGRIDRVDYIEHPEGTGWFVVDYKTGRLPRARDIDEGRSLQLPLYAEAVEQLLGGCSPGGVYYRVGPRSEKRAFSAIEPRRKDEDFAERRSEIRTRVGEFVQAMAEGRFPAIPTHDCPPWCPYRAICQYSPARARLQTGEIEGGTG